jgi:hypothetical protein
MNSKKISNVCSVFKRLGTAFTAIILLFLSTGMYSMVAADTGSSTTSDTTTPSNALAYPGLAYGSITATPDTNPAYANETVMTGSLPVNTIGPVRVSIQLEEDATTLANPVPKVINLDDVGSQVVTSGSFSIPVPKVAYGNYIITATEDNERSVTFATDSSTAPSDLVTIKTAPFAETTGIRMADVPQQNQCQLILQSQQYVKTRIGELHVADDPDMVGSFEYSNQADSIFSQGYSVDDQDFSARGTKTISNSIAQDTYLNRTDGYVKYVDDNMWNGKYKLEGTCTPYWTVETLTSVGDVFDGVNTPRSNPWGTCHNAPSNAFILTRHGGFDSDKSTAVSYDGVAKAFGFEIGGHTGYTSTIKISYRNNGNTPTYLCGRTHNLDDAPTLFNGLW